MWKKFNFYENENKQNWSITVQNKKESTLETFTNLPIITLAGTAFHSNQNVINDDVTNIIPGIKTVVK